MIVGLVLFVTAGVTLFLVLGHLSNYRSPNTSYGLSFMGWGLHWLSSDNYTPEGQRRLARLLPWIWLLWALEAAGGITFFTHL